MASLMRGNTHKHTICFWPNLKHYVMLHGNQLALDIRHYCLLSFLPHLGSSHKEQQQQKLQQQQISQATAESTLIYAVHLLVCCQSYGQSSNFALRTVFDCDFADLPGWMADCLLCRYQKLFKDCDDGSAALPFDGKSRSSNNSTWLPIKLFSGCR